MTPAIASRRAAPSRPTCAGSAAPRQAAFGAFARREGEGLERFATWCSFDEAWGITTSSWPEGVRHPTGPEVAAYRERFAARVDFFKKLQWLIDEQLAQVQAAARAAAVASVIAASRRPRSCSRLTQAASQRR